MKKRVLLVSPMHNNGGITSWTKKYIKDFPQTKYELVQVISDPKRKPGEISLFRRIMSGMMAFYRVMKEVHIVINRNEIDILHKTTSGSLGAFMDWRLGLYCRKHGLKNILHCHYGCIPKVLTRKGLVSWLTLKSMQQFNQIWVLDRRTYQYLESRKDIKAEIILTPNCISVEDNMEIIPKSYTNVAFIGNLYETKGVLNLVEAMKRVPEDITLHLIGDGDKQIRRRIQENAGVLWGNKVKYYGRLPNTEAIELMKRMDILALPTYYPFEAFPISILEAMSLGKLVISTYRAAIGDILTTEDGRECGVFVREKNIDDIVNAIHWAYSNKKDADELCKLAYQKVYSSYRTEVVYKLYSDCYLKVLRTL